MGEEQRNDWFGFWTAELGEASGARPELQVVFHRPDAGWIDLHVLPLTRGWHVSSTHLNDTFPDMLLWLEHILSEEEPAIWLADGESRATRFIYLPASYSFFNTAGSGLLALHNAHDLAWTFGFWRGTALEVAQAFYPAFRRYVQSDEYDPREWEIQLDEDGDKIGSWDGWQLRLLRSPMVEAALRDERPEQLGFNFKGWTRRR